MPETWLDLLLAGVSVDAIYRRRDELVRAGVDAAQRLSHARRRAETEWLSGAVALDDKGFVGTGTSVGPDEPGLGHTLSHPLATSCPGIFAVGDVRWGSLKRVASAVGEGAVVVRSVHEALAAELADR